MEKQVTFKGRSYKAKELPLPALLAAEGMKAQYGIEGKRGAIGLLQVFERSRRVVWISSSTRVETEWA